MSLAIIYLLIVLYFILSWLFISLAIYCIPTIVAYVRKHKNITAIIILNLAFGWTFVGWLASLLWALNADIEDEQD